MTAPSILWLRQDLRLHDQPALAAACADGPVIPVYVLDDEAPGERRIGAAQHWWLHHSLKRLGMAFAEKGAPLVLRRGHSVSILASIAQQTGARRVHAIRHYEPWWQRLESELAAELELALHDGNHLAPPASILTGGGTRYRVFTPWWRALLERMPPPTPLPAPDMIVPSSVELESDTLEDWRLRPKSPDWAEGFAVWTPGEDGARQALRDFLPHLHAYDTARNLPAVSGTSRLSPHLHFGEISPATVWHVAAKEVGKAAAPFLRELGWRDYATNLIDQFPGYPERSGKPAYDRFPWRSGAQADREFDAWTMGRTGYPIVDAGMRELWATGWMHNRVRMIAASFLIKHLLIDWRRGEKWFWDTLVDADFGANASNWQWVAGTGVDAPLFSRIMAPLSQSEKFDAGGYIRKWVPELASVSDPYVHDPDAFGVRPHDYPSKIIGHREARERALIAMRETRDGA
jgi:deoxyribodipyrimidine photo-lyase